MTNHINAWQKMIENLNDRFDPSFDIEEDFVQPLVEDYEADMALTELKSISDKALQLAEEIEKKKNAMGGELELAAWCQSKITKCNDYMNSVYDYMMYSGDENS